MKNLPISPTQLGEDMRKIGIFLLLAGAVGYFIGGELVRNQPETLVLISTGLVTWVVGLLFSNER